MITEWITFALSNFTLTFLVIGLLVSLVVLSAQQKFGLRGRGSNRL